MARPATPSPRGPRRVLSASSLLRNSSLRPIIASRGEGQPHPNAREPDASSTSAAAAAAAARLSQIRYVNDRSTVVVPSTPRHLYDYDSSDEGVPYYNYNGYYQHHRYNNGGAGSNRTRVDGLVVPYVGGGGGDVVKAVDLYGSPSPSPRRPGVMAAQFPSSSSPGPPDHRHTPWPRPPPRRRRRRRRRGGGGGGGGRRWRRKQGMWIRPNYCYVLLKMIQVLTCMGALVVSRMGADDLDLDLVYTFFATFGTLVSGISLLILWVKGHPYPGDCLHTTVLLSYSIAVPTLLCGAILILLQSSPDTLYVTLLTVLLFLGVAWLSVDVLVMAASILQCGRPAAGDWNHARLVSKVYPVAAATTTYDDHGYDDDDPRRPGDAYRHHYRHREGYPPNDPRHPYPFGDGDGMYRHSASLHPAYPTSLPQMSVVRTWRGYPQPYTWR